MSSILHLARKNCKRANSCLQCFLIAKLAENTAHFRAKNARTQKVRAKRTYLPNTSRLAVLPG